MEPGKDIYPINGSPFFCKFKLTGPSIDEEGPGEINFRAVQQCDRDSK